MSESTAHLPPTYKQMFEEMGKHIGQRKKLLLERAALITWPLILLSLLSSAFKDVPVLGAIRDNNPMAFGVVFIPLILAAILYVWVCTFIFHIEKCIWIDSYFDQKNLEPKDSWRIAKKLFWPGFRFGLNVLIKYYLISITLSILALGLLVAAIWQAVDMTKGGGDMTAPAILFLNAIGIFIFTGIYNYYLRIRTRYTWFIFLDRLGENYSFDFVTAEVERLNQISRSDTFKKSLVANFGTDVVKGVTDMVVGVIGHGMAALGSAGEAVGKAAAIYGKEVGRQAASLGNLSAQYLLYRFARKELYGQEQQVNESLYSL